MSVRDVVVLSSVRSAIGTFNGALADIEPAELAGTVMKAAIERSGVDPKSIHYATVGNTIPTEARSAYVARVAAIQAGLPMDSVAMTVNRLCSSGLQAIVTTAQSILLGDCEFGVGGGVEVMSRGGYLSPSMRNGARIGHSQMIDMVVATLTDPFGVGHMGMTAENLAAKWGIGREELAAWVMPIRCTPSMQERNSCVIWKVSLPARSWVISCQRAKRGPIWRNRRQVATSPRCAINGKDDTAAAGRVR